MGQFLVQYDATVVCAHSFPAQPQTCGSRVLIDGQPLILQSSGYLVSGCINQPYLGGPCKLASWTVASSRVKSESQPVVLQNSTSNAISPGLPLRVLVTQMRVKGE